MGKFTALLTTLPKINTQRLRVTLSPASAPATTPMASMPHD